MTQGGEVTVTAALLFRDGHLFVARRPPEKALGGYWEFPGGKRERGETLEQALEREIFEELGIRIRVGERFHVVRHRYPHMEVVLHVFWCSIVAGTIRLKEHSAGSWVRLAQLRELRLSPADRQLLPLLETALAAAHG